MVNTYQTIVVNYWTCTFISLIILGNLSFITIESLKSWMWFAFILGGIFVSTFYLIARATQEFDVSVASLASKISLVIPVVASLVIFKSFARPFDFLNYIGLVMTVIAIFLSSFRKKNLEKKISPGILLLPGAVFILSGIIDTSLNYASLHLIQPGEGYAFTACLFFSAAFLGTIVLAGKHKKIDTKSLGWGAALGIINIFTVVYLLEVLAYFNNDGAFVFPIVNIGIILAATLVSIVFFQDKLNKLKIAGLSIGILSLLLLAHQEIINFFRM